MRYVPRSTEFSDGDYKAKYLLSGGRLFGLRRTAEGALVPAFGTEKLQQEGMPAAAQAAYFSSGGDLYLYNSGSLYRSTGAYGNFFLFGSNFTSPPFFAECHEGEEDFAIISDGSLALRAEESSVQDDTCPPVCSAVVHYSRLFGVDTSDKRMVRWSAAGDAHDWTENISGAGYVRLDAPRGDISKLVVFDDKLIAVRKYGLTVLRVFGDAESFRVDVTDTDTDEIVADTVSVCGGKLYFFTPSGLYRYDGTVEKYEPEGLEEFCEAACAAACGGWLYAGGKLGEDDVIACIGCESGEVSYIKQRADCICAAGRVFFFGDGLYEIKPDAASSGEWESDVLDFGTPEKKFLERVEAAGSVSSLTVNCGGRSRTFTGGGNTFKTGICGRQFTFSLFCSGKVYRLCARYAIRR